MWEAQGALQGINMVRYWTGFRMTPENDSALYVAVVLIADATLSGFVEVWGACPLKRPVLLAAAMQPDLPFEKFSSILEEGRAAERERTAHLAVCQPTEERDSAVCLARNASKRTLEEGLVHGRETEV